MVRMVGLAYGVFPFKHIFVVLSSFLLPGHWAYAAGVWLSSPVGALTHETSRCPIIVDLLMMRVKHAVHEVSVRWRY